MKLRVAPTTGVNLIARRGVGNLCETLRPEIAIMGTDNTLPSVSCPSFFKGVATVKTTNEQYFINGHKQLYDSYNRKDAVMFFLSSNGHVVLND